MLTGRFQARMTSLPNDNLPRPVWEKGLHWEHSYPFRVQWIVRYDTPFWRVGHLRNPLNEGLQVFVAKDGQEIPFKIGCDLVNVIDETWNESTGLSSPANRGFDKDGQNPRFRGRDRERDRHGEHDFGPQKWERPRSRPNGPYRTGSGYKPFWAKRESGEGGTW